MTIPTALTVSRQSGTWIIPLATVFALLAFIFWDGLAEMAWHWSLAQYSHGYLIPLIAVFMAAQRGERLVRLPLAGSWMGVFVIAAGLVFCTAGELSTLYPLIQYGFLICLTGLILAGLGVRATLLLAPALIYLWFMVPVPPFFSIGLSAQLQLLSTDIGVLVLRLFSVPVFVDGNVIDLGAYKLQVAEACSGLRYLFPFMSFGFLVAYLYRGPLWQRGVLFVSTVPIAILMNSVRVGIIGLAVNHWGIGAAEGFLHLFEGWVVFVACLALLAAEAALLLRWGGPGGPLSLALDTAVPAIPSNGWQRLRETLRIDPRTPLFTGLALLTFAAVLSAVVARQPEVRPAHRPLALFPLRVDGWQGRPVTFDPAILDQLKLDDYVNIDYVAPASGGMVNFYVAYYDSQRKGVSLHSPHNCIPGAGWEVERISHWSLSRLTPDQLPLRVNRVVIRKGLSRSLVYYWFQQRGRTMTEEYAAKWYLLVDSLTRHRTDGALIRLVTPVRDSESLASADARLAEFAHHAVPQLKGFIPD